MSIQKILTLAVTTAVLAGPTYAQGHLTDVFGPPVDEYVGRQMANAGDIDNDGFDDLILGQPNDDTIDNDAGRVDVRSGKDWTVLFTRYGVSSYDGVGSQVAGLGDVNNDGFDDFAYGADHEGLNQGGVHVVSGQSGADLWVRMGGNYEYLGFAMTNVGDFDNDGVDDVGVGSELMGNGGQVDVFSGVDGTTLFSLIGIADQRLGRRVGPAGDINGDGYDDLIVADGKDHGQGPHEGRVYVIDAQSKSVMHTLAAPTGAKFFGRCFAGLDDLDGDGFAEFVIGSGMSSTPDSKLRVHSGLTGALLYHVPANSDLGYSVAVFADRDGDGYRDFAVGDRSASDVGAFAGAVRLISAKTGAVIASLYSDGLQEAFGENVITMGDLTGNGMEELAVGEPGHGANDTGRVRVHSLGQCGGIASYAAGCNGTGGFAPNLEIDGCAASWQSIDVTIGKAYGGEIAYLLIGLQTASIPLGNGCSIALDPLPIVPILPLPGPPAAGEGEISFSAPLPAIGHAFSAYIQAVCTDPGAPGGLSATNAVGIDFVP